MRPLVNRSLAELIRRRTQEVNRLVLSVPQLLAAWNGDADAAARLGESIADLLALPELARRTYRDAWDDLSAARVPDMQETGEAVFALWDECLRALEYAREAATVFARYGHAVPNVERLDAAIAAARAERDYAHKGWPWMSEEDERAIRAEVAAGGGIPVSEILRELQAGGSR